MKLSVKDVADLTGLSVSTVRQYAWRMKIGTKEGTRKFFTREEAKKLHSTQPKTAKPAKKGAASRKSPASKRKR